MVVPLIGATGAMDPAGDPGATGDPGASGDSGATGDPPGMGATGGQDPLTPSIDPLSVLGQFDQASMWNFLHDPGTTSGDPGGSGNSSGSSQPLVVQAGQFLSESYSVNQGDKLDLTQVLAGTPLAVDLTNINQFINALGSGKSDPNFGSGSKMTQDASDPSGGAIVSAHGSGKLEDLLNNDWLHHQQSSHGGEGGGTG